MSNEEVTRQRRIVSLVPPVQTSNLASVAKPAEHPLTRRIERFQRALLPPFSSQSKLPEQLAENCLHAQCVPEVEQKPSQIKPDCPNVDVESDSKLAIDSQADVMALGTLADETSKHREYRHTTVPDGTKIAPRIAVPKWVVELADLVSHTCGQSDKSFSHWSIVIPIDPAVLPDTTLRLDLSPSRLLLRFCTQSTHSLNLISKHNTSLISLLVHSVSEIQNIEIDIT